MTPSGRRPDQLPRGKHGLSREAVVSSQRGRILDAMAQAVGDHGFGETRVAEVILLAGVSKKSFYEHFSTKEACFVAAFDRALEPLLALTHGALATQDGCAERMRAGLGALLLALQRDPVTARLCFVEVLAAGPEAVARRNEAVRAFAEVLGPDRCDLPDGRLTPLASLSVVGGLMEVLYQEISERGTAGLPELLPDLMYTVVLPLLGREAAERELERGRDGRV